MKKIGYKIFAGSLLLLLLFGVTVSRAKQLFHRKILSCKFSKEFLLLPCYFIFSFVYAGVVRIKIIKIESPTFGGRTFGAAGTYEKIIGKEYCEVNPSSPKNSIITDIEYAQKNKDGLVSYSMDFYILKPVDERKGNHKLFFEINNRGGEASGQFIPFAKTKAQRLQMRDPRLSLEERYGTHEGYVDTVKKAVASLEKQRLLLKEDGDKYVEDAEKSSILK